MLPSGESLNKNAGAMGSGGNGKIMSGYGKLG